MKLKKSLIISSLAIICSTGIVYADGVVLNPSNQAQAGYAGSCEDIMDQAYNESVARESEVLEKAKKTASDKFDSFKNGLKNGVNSCVGRLKNISVGFNSLPGADQIIDHVVKAGVNAAESACNGMIDQANNAVSGQIDKYVSNPINAAQRSFSNSLGKSPLMNQAFGSTINGIRSPITLGR